MKIIKSSNWGLSGEKTCQSCRSRQELSNEYFATYLQKSASIQPRTSRLKFSNFVVVRQQTKGLLLLHNLYQGRVPRKLTQRSTCWILTTSTRQGNMQDLFRTSNNLVAIRSIWKWKGTARGNLLRTRTRIRILGRTWVWICATKYGRR